MLPTKFWFIWPSGFGGEDFLKSANQKQELSVVAMFVNGSGWNEQSLSRTFHRCFLPSFGSFDQAVSEKIFKNRPIRKQELPEVAMFVNRSGQNEQFLERTFHRCFLPIFVHLAERFQRRRLKCEKLTDDRRQVMAKKLTLPLARWAKKFNWVIFSVKDISILQSTYIIYNKNTVFKIATTLSNAKFGINVNYNNKNNKFNTDINRWTPVVKG